MVPMLALKTIICGPTATYDDDDGNERTFAAVSVNRVRAEPDSTDPDATFPTGANARSVDENSPADTKVGKPVGGQRHW